MNSLKKAFSDIINGPPCLRKINIFNTTKQCFIFKYKTGMYSIEIINLHNKQIQYLIDIIFSYGCKKFYVSIERYSIEIYGNKLQLNKIIEVIENDK
jgi:hypothetical protein